MLENLFMTFGMKMTKQNNRVLSKSDFKKKIKINKKTGCWEWTGSRNKEGYGYLSYKNDTEYAHRVAICLFTKASIKNVFVCHECDNPGCVNTKHLFIGNAKINKLDSVSKRRHTFGIRQPGAKLSEEDVLYIRKYYKRFDPKFNMYMLAKKYGVRPCTIDKVINRVSWRHI